MKPKLFVGSSREALGIADAVHENLHYEVEVTVWDQGIFNLSESAVDSLLETLDRMDFGVFIFALDDVVNIRGQENRAARDNVVFELGLYIGRLGRQRAFVFLPQEHGDLRLPTDIVGMTTAIYESDRSDDNLVSATAVACNQARRRIQELGSSTEPDAPARVVRQEVGRSAEIRALDGEEVRDHNVQDEQPDTSWEQAEDDKDYEKAIERLQEKIEATDEEEDKRFLELQVGRIKAWLDFNQGIKYLEDKIEEQPDDAVGYYTLAWTYENHELDDESLAALDRGIESATRTVPLLWFKAAQLSFIGDTDRAKTILRKALEDEPGYEPAYTQLAHILITEGEYDEAKDLYESGLKALPNDEDLLFGYARLLEERKENEAALAMYTKLDRLYPDNSDYLTSLGNVYVTFNLNSLALEAYQKANTIAEENQGWVLENIGNLYNSRGFYSQAIDFLKRARELDPNSPYGADRLARALRLHGEERQRARKIIQEHRRTARSG